MGGGGMSDDELGDSAGMVRNEGEPSLKLPRVDGADDPGHAEPEHPGISPSSMRVSQTLSYQLEQVGEQGLQCASCSGPFVSELKSPNSTWQWWGAKCNVRAGHKFTAGSHVSYTFYLCAGCRQCAWRSAREASRRLPTDMWSKDAEEEVFITACKGLARTALFKLLKSDKSEIDVFNVWIEDD